MGRDNLLHVIKQVNEPKFRSALENQQHGYETVYDKANEMLHQMGERPEPSSAMAKTMAHVSTVMQTIVDDSPSNIAEMVLQGSSMGIAKMTKRLHQYDGENQRIVKLAEKLIRMEQANIEEMKKYL